MVNRRQLLKLSFLGFATFTVASVAPSSVRGDGLRKQFVDLDLSVKGFSDRETSVWEFADLVTVRPSSNPSTWDWTPAVQALLNRGGKVLLPKNIIYTVNATLRMKSNTWLVINGTLKFADQKNTLSNEQSDEIYDLYIKAKNEGQEIIGQSRWVPFAEIEENEFNLNIARYVQKPLEQETMTLEQALSDFTTKMADLEKAELELETLLKAQGFKIKDVG